VRGLESEKGGRGMGKGMGVVTEESGIHGRYIVEVLLGIWPGYGQSKIRDGGDQSGR